MRNRMTEDTTPENLRKFLESDDNDEISEGLSILKEQKNPELYQYLFAIAYWNPDEELAEAAKSIIENELDGAFDEWDYEDIEFEADFLIDQLEKISSYYDEEQLDTIANIIFENFPGEELKNPKKARNVLRNILNDYDCFLIETFPIAILARGMVSGMIRDGLWKGSKKDMRLMLDCLSRASSSYEIYRDDYGLWYEDEPNQWVAMALCFVENNADADILIETLEIYIDDYDLRNEPNAWEFRVLYCIMMYGIDFEHTTSLNVKNKIEEAGENQGITEPHILRVKEAARKIIVENGLDPEDTWAFAFEEA
jgi:hypothetical protein